MITIVDKAMSMVGCKDTWSDREKIKKNIVNAIRNFAVNSTSADVSMPKSGNGSNIKIGKVSIKTAASKFTFTLQSSSNQDYTYFVMSRWLFQSLAIDELV